MSEEKTKDEAVSVDKLEDPVEVETSAWAAPKIDGHHVDTESLPLTQGFDVGSEQTGAVPVIGDAGESLAKHGAPATGSADAMTPDPLTGALPTLAGAADGEPARPVKVPAGSAEQRGLKRWVLILVLLAAWIPAALIGLLLYQHWFEQLLPHDKNAVVVYVLMWVFTCVVLALLLAMVEPRPIIAALAIAVLTAPATSVAAAGVKYGYAACTAPAGSFANNQCPEPLRSWAR